MYIWHWNAISFHINFLSGCQVILYSYIFRILLYFLYLPKISYITSQNTIFSHNYEKKCWIFSIEWKFHITWQIEVIQDINADTSIVFSWTCIYIATDAFMWRFYCWIFLGFKFTWSHIYFSTVVFCGTCPFLAHLAKGNVSFSHHLASVVCRPFLHFNLLLWNPSAKWSETW